MKQCSNTKRHFARRILSGMLSVAVVLTGLVTTAIPTRAAAAAATHYEFVATSDADANFAELQPNLEVGAQAGTYDLVRYNTNATFYMQDGSLNSVRLFRLMNDVSKNSNSAQAADKDYHYGLKDYVTYCSNDLYKDGSSTYSKVAKTNLEIVPKSFQPLDTTAVGAANLSLVIACSMTAGSLNVAFDRRLQVKVSLDGTNWLSDKAEIRSVKFLGGGTDFQLFRIETDDLLSIDDVKGNTIKAIKILPEGGSDCTGGNFYINQMQVKTYATAGDFGTLCPEEVIATSTYDPNELRKIALAEALRVAQTQWTTDVEITTIAPEGSSSVTSQDWLKKTYNTGTTYRAPIYDREADASREQYWSQFIDDDGLTWKDHSMTVTLPGDASATTITVSTPANAKYTQGDLVMSESHDNSDGTVTSNHPYGMDCQTFVFNSISRISRTSAVGAAGTLGATRTRIVGDWTGVGTNHPAYTDADIIKLALDKAKAAATDSTLQSFDTSLYATTKTAAEIAEMSWLEYTEKKAQQQQRTNIDALAQQVYASYAAAQPGDIAVHNLTNAKRNVHTRLVKYVDVKTNSDGTINPATSIMYFLGQEGTAAQRTDGSDTYNSSAMANGSVTFDKLLKESYVVYSLNEYKDGVVEDARVQAIVASKQPNTDFWNGGLNLAFNSNYRIISHQMTLKNSTGTTLYDTGVEYPINPCATGINYTSSEMDARLSNLPNGTYTLTWTVDTSRFKSLEESSETTSFSDSITFTVTGRNNEDKCKDIGSWYTLNGTTTLTNRYYRLDQDITGTITVPSGVTATLCLNGHSITAPADAYAITVTGGTLTLCNCSETVAYVTGTSSASMISVSGGTLNLQNGVIVTNKGTPEVGGGVLVYDGGTFNMNGGAIVGCKAGKGGGVYVNDNATNMFNMSGGIITNNTATDSANGSAVYALKGTIKIIGGHIEGGQNTLYGLSGSVYNISGGAVYGKLVPGGSSATFNVSGNTLVYGDVSSYGIVNVDGGTVYGNIIGYRTVNMSGGTVYGKVSAAIKKTTATYTDANGNQQSYISSVDYCGTVNISGSSVFGKVIDESGVVEVGKPDEVVETTCTCKMIVTGGKFSAAMSRDELLSFIPEESDTMTAQCSVMDYSGDPTGELVYEVGEGWYAEVGDGFMDFGSSLDFCVYLSAHRNEPDPTGITEANGYRATVTGKDKPYEASLMTTDYGKLAIMAHGIAAKEMQDDITFQLTKDGKVCFNKTLSVYDMAAIWHGDEDTRDQTMLADMINYGNEARKAFQYYYTEGDVLPTLTGATTEDPVWGATAGAGVTNNQQKNVAATLSLRERIELNIYVNNKAAQISNVKFNGMYYAEDNYKVDISSGTYTRFTFDNIPVVKAKGALEFTVTMDDGTKFDMTYSIMDYARSAVLVENNSQKDLIIALQKYVDSVYAYLGVTNEWVTPDADDDEMGVVILPVISSN